ncbi:MAG TPA: hypothetical protein VFU76_04180 [Terriglobales bacterium]|nr:hypothetical protein [Terriglobales bacterium]
MIAAVILLAAAAVIALILRPDPQGHAAWFFALMPGATAAPAFLDIEWKLFHRAGPEVMWTAVVLFSYVWYFVLSYLAIKVYRRVHASH